MLARAFSWALDEMVLKCSLALIKFSTYPVFVTSDQRARLRAAFPQGVCDYSRPGVGERAPLGTWSSYGDRSG